MPRKKEIGRSANGIGTIRKKTVTKNGKEYTYWEARCTVGYDPGTGRQIQRSITGKTQKEVTQKLKVMTVEVDQGYYKPPCKLTVKDWLETWMFFFDSFGRSTLSIGFFKMISCFRAKANIMFRVLW